MFGVLDLIRTLAEPSDLESLAREVPVKANSGPSLAQDYTLPGKRTIKPKLICIPNKRNYWVFEKKRAKSNVIPCAPKLTALLWSIWTGSSFIYYGVVLMTTELFETPGSHGVCSLDGALKVQCSAQCRQLDRLDYTHLLWTTLAEFPGILLTILLVDKIGRRKTMMAELLLLCISLCFLFKCSLDRTFITVILFFVRGLASGVFQAAYVRIS